MPPQTPILSYFTRLSPSVYYLPRPTSIASPSPLQAPTPISSSTTGAATPPSAAPTPPPAPQTVPALAYPSTSTPRLVVLGTWMGAQPAHMDKYIEPYRTLFPTTPILVLRSEARDWLSPWAKPDMSAAASVVRSIFPEISDSSPTPSIVSSTTSPDSSTSTLSPSGGRAGKPELLIHVWSNGGSASLARLRQALFKQSARLPPFTLILDSTPGQFRYKATYAAFSLVAPKKWAWLLKPFLHGFVAWFWLLTYVRAKLDFRRRKDVEDSHFLHKTKPAGPKPFGPLALLAASHNVRDLLALEARRTYIFSKEDALIPIEDVQAHAADAEAKGFKVREEEFIGTMHVAHARKEPERYWRVVRETWEGKPLELSKAEEAEEEREHQAAEEQATAA